MSATIYIKSPHEIELMRQAAKIAAGARSMGRQAVRDGLTTHQIDRAVHEYIVKSGATPSCLGYEGFPAATCVSVNEEVTETSSPSTCAQPIRGSWATARGPTPSAR